MKEAEKIAKNPVEEDSAVNEISASQVSTPEPPEPVPTEAPEEESKEKPPELFNSQNVSLDLSMP
ncbi:hypothetical protein Pmar_PMAR009048 [Perkinsus marinus ATCC 50983]|uniref:Uncharacterized protein n=1 Tax=Perkinsus marinus (strain ATCC 50983 / TXsc) TaxID=423536 RepID=C5LKW7_PERM5|nr:hypothetical protein Pmar_PMAR009048 [Perkinsus marinus ATCC 50983]EER02626.1 hypothetical protein Pmar_PMAR009048 [Perkinsus marinus ATCC 50983]|eukprot:XP_002769908.1 hypothetical protein Pmar_PMAR009048 [Perkinsus marinus ATCC 50983]